jgi:hypothetical protein
MNYRFLRSMQAVFRCLPMTPAERQPGRRQITLAEVAKQPDRSDPTGHGYR